VVIGVEDFSIRGVICAPAVADLGITRTTRGRSAGAAMNTIEYMGSGVLAAVSSVGATRVVAEAGVTSLSAARPSPICSGDSLHD
jgi:hypothetical protein